MSDYGEDDLSDYGDEFFYVEDEYSAADDLAEHVVGSPPPTTYGDEEATEDWDRFDYFNDLEYASDGYDDANFYTHGSQEAQTGQKRKRGNVSGHGRKKQKGGKDYVVLSPRAQEYKLQPVVWRSQAERGVKPKLLNEDVEPYALLKDWRERMADTPAWAAGAPKSDPTNSKASALGKSRSTEMSEPISPSAESEVDEEGDGEIDPAVLMAALQKNLAVAGGPLSGMDPQQLLQFAMRMMSDQDAGDDIAGELADNMLDQGQDEEEGSDEGEAPADLLSWLSKHREPTHVDPPNPDTAPTATMTKSPEAKRESGRPPTPPSSQANRSYHTFEDAMELDNPRTKNAATFKQNGTSSSNSQEVLGRKRKANDNDDLDNTGTEAKKRATRSYLTTTAASQAKAVPSVKAKRSRPGKGK